ncbi:hypothetical protein SapgrDRAFT_2403 [Saprospira grandis DSM 2844]|uniref:Toprim domain-containing protein n=1 Tax=Saprospira grandis DSM 2844 TaxID=694433 RepID=J0P2N6_9BACT|nr:AAA family ATPase [Saprospira grandis]EJF54069.1 hypothetical protein SapgrDRAFT_2403 [Saprospira grandis DSM 2844]
MKLKRLEINGYKNLQNKTIFNFENCTNYVALIGLNGSGKSNVLEAISKIIYSYFYKQPISDFTFLFEYEKEGKLIRLENNKVYVNNRERKRSFKGFLPVQVVASYSGEETRLWEDIFEEPYLKYFNKIKLNYINQKLRFLYINKFSWSNALLALLCHNEGKEFIKELLGINDLQGEIKIQFQFSEKYEDRKSKFSIADTSILTIPQLTDRIKREQEDEEDKYLQISQIASIDLGNIQNEYQNREWCKRFFEYLFLATSPKNKKLITGVKIEFGNKDIRKLSEGEKKILLIKCISTILASENSIVLLDEPDSHVHLDRKKQIVDTFTNTEHISFFTTHSPTLTKYCAKENIFKIEDGEVTVANTIYEGVEYLIDEDDVLKTMFSSNDIIICEGKTDDIYISKALQHFRDEYPTLQFDFLRVGGTDSDNIKHLLEKFRVDNDKKIIIVVDRDDAGYKVFKSLFPYSNKERQAVEIEVFNETGNIVFLMIPPTNSENVSGEFLIENYFNNDKIKELAKEEIESKFLDNTSFAKFPNIKYNLKKEILRKHCNQSTPDDMIAFKTLLNKLAEIMTE